MNQVTVAAVQMACDWEIDANIAKAAHFVQQAAQQGAQIILLPELFSTPYFCKDQQEDYFDLAQPVANHPLLIQFAKLAKALKVVLPISFFERSNNVFYNSIMIIDADGEFLGIYRKTHIPDGPGYQEKFYFAPGNSGFKVWQTAYGKIGVGICWDQWFPESARIMALKGAELLFYPTAIGSEPHDPSIDSYTHWQRVMQGHAAANLMPVIAANRIGREAGQSCEITFYGGSFITEATGKIQKTLDATHEGLILDSFDLPQLAKFRQTWGIFRDRRPSQYAALLSLDP